MLGGLADDERDLIPQMSPTDLSPRLNHAAHAARLHTASWADEHREIQPFEPPGAPKTIGVDLYMKITITPRVGREVCTVRFGEGFRMRARSGHSEPA